MVHTTAVSGGLVGNAISQELLGTNMLFHRDRTSENSAFSNIIDRLGTTVIRYPGGTVTEEYFDITDPNRQVQQNILDVMSGASSIRTQEVTTLSEYLTYANSRGGDPVIVLPTYRYFDAQTGTVTAEAEGEFRTFIRELLSDQYGAVDNVVLEIGNEWYQRRFDWSIEQFGQLQRQVAGWIDDEARQMGLRDDLTLLVQSGRSAADNTSLASHFSDSAAPRVDGVLNHIYATNSAGNTLGIGGAIGRRLEEIHAAWGPVIGEDFKLAVTEWNVGENGEETNIINGIMRSAPLLRVYAEMLQGGVDMAMIWSANTNGPAGLSTSGGGGSDLSPTGYFYNMVSESTRGLQLVDPAGQFKLNDSNGNALGYTYSFSGQGRSVTYFASGVDTAITLQASMAGHYTDGAYVYARILDVAPGDVAQDYWSGAAITFETNISLGGAERLYQATLNPYQMVELHIVHGQGVRLAGDDRHYIGDRLTGTFYGDVIDGNGGNDFLRGRAGDDRMNGGAGRDVLVGDWGNDTLSGGDGNDYLYGGWGNDLLFGGAGDDLIRGNADDDEIHGEEGTDRLFGGDGNDLIFGGAGRDYLVGEGGDDTLHGEDGDDFLYGGAGNDMLRGGAGNDVIRGSAGEDVIHGDAGTDRLHGGEGNDLIYGGTDRDYLMGEGGHDTLLGGVGDDYLYGGSGSDVLYGGDGNDRLLGHSDDDELHGDAGSDTLLGGSGNDRMFGGAGRDFLYGQGGDDILDGGTGDDNLHGGAGADVFVFRNQGYGVDRILDFEVGLDRIDLTDFGFSNVGDVFDRVTDLDSGLKIDFGGGNMLWLAGIFEADLDASHFLI